MGTQSNSGVSWNRGGASVLLTVMAPVRCGCLQRGLDQKPVPLPLGCPGRGRDRNVSTQWKGSSDLRRRVAVTVTAG